MPTYIALVNFTESGIRDIKGSPARAEAFRKVAEALGASVRDVYWTTGAHDGLLVVETPDDATAAALFLSLAKAGNVRTQTMRAFDRAEMEAILGKVK